MALLAIQRVYNRLTLERIEALGGLNALEMPCFGLCFAGPSGEERWRDCRVLDVRQTKESVVRIESLGDANLTVPTKRIIPKLRLPLIRHFAAQLGSRTNVDKKIKVTSRGQDSNHGRELETRIRELHSNHISSLFPLTVGNASVTLSEQPVDLSDFGTEMIQADFSCISPTPATSSPFANIRQGLSALEIRTVKEHPVVVFCTARHQSAVTNALRDWNNPRNEFAGFKGMPVHFGVRLVPVANTPFVASHVSSYIDLASKFVHSPDENMRNALAIFVLDDRDEPYKTPVPLYFRIKALMARTGHASQIVESTTLNNKYATWNITLNIAAKLGVVPWTLADKEVLDPVDLFLGFSYSSLRTEQLGERRNIAYVNVFDRLGAWRFLCADSSTFSFEERFRVFPVIAAEAVETATQNPDKLRLVEVHYNKRFGRKEREAVAGGIRRIAPKASILFVSMTKDHPIRLFDEEFPEMASPRGTHIQLDDMTSYLQTVDASSQTGMPHPLRLQLYRDFCELPATPPEVARRILALSRLNWRSVRDHAALPVTILYSGLVARLSNYFSLEAWSEFVDHKLKRTPWFL